MMSLFTKYLSRIIFIITTQNKFSQRINKKIRNANILFQFSVMLIVLLMQDLKPKIILTIECVPIVCSISKIKLTFSNDAYRI